MRRWLSIIFLSLYFYNIAGYLIIFSVTQARIRSEIKNVLKARIPETDLDTLSFCTSALAGGDYPLQWIDDHEFRFDGKMYDILRSYVRDDSTYFVCINDAQEEQLFANLDSHVQREMGSSGQTEKFDAFKDIFKDSLTRFPAPDGEPEAKIVSLSITTDSYLQIEPEVPALPPRLLLS